MSGTILALLASILFGATVATPLMLSRAIRDRIKSKELIRLRTVAIYGTLSLLAGFALFTRLGTDMRFLAGLYGMGEAADDVEQSDQEAVLRELWYRLMTPPPLRPTCYADDVVVCDLSDDFAAVSGETAWGGEAYWQLVGLGVISGLTSAGLVWLLTRHGSADDEEGGKDDGVHTTSSDTQ